MKGGQGERGYVGVGHIHLPPLCLFVGGDDVLSLPLTALSRSADDDGDDDDDDGGLMVVRSRPGRCCVC